MKKEVIIIIIVLVIIIVLGTSNIKLEKLKTGEAARIKSLEQTTNLIAHWKFDEGQGDIIYDSMNNNNGYRYGATWTTDCISGTCLYFNGIDNFVDFGGGENNPLTTTTTTIELWFKADKIIDGAVLYGKVQNLVSPNDYYIWFDNGRAFFTIYNNRNYVVDASTPINANQWYYIAATYDKISEGKKPNMYLYLNGDLVSNNKQTNLKENIKSLRSGLGFKGTFNYYNGVIDEIKIYNIELTPEEIKQHYLNP